MPVMRTSTRCTRRHSNAVLHGDNDARTGSRLRLSAMRNKHRVPRTRTMETAGMAIMLRDAHMNTEPEIILAGRDAEMRGLYRQQVTDRLGHLERYNGGVTRYEVEFDHELNPRQSTTSHRVVITGRGTGPTVHAESWGADFRAALDGAVSKLEEQLRRRRDRRRVRHDRARHLAVDPARESPRQSVPGETPRSGSTLPTPGAAPLLSGAPIVEDGEDGVLTTTLHDA